MRVRKAGDIIMLIGYCLSLIFPPQALRLCHKLYYKLYTGYYCRGFRNFGSSTRITPPLRKLVGAQYISVGSGVSIGANVQLTAWDSFAGIKFSPEIIVGDNVSIGDFSHITAINSIRIGNNVLTGKNILITDNAHGRCEACESAIPPSRREPYSKGAVVIEDNVWIGEKASIMPGVTIGYGAIIGAAAVVTKDVPPYSIAVGNPAKVIRQM